MEEQYPISLKGKHVGQAQITKEGLYYRITCHCVLDDEQLHRIILHTQEKSLDLGICVPDREVFTINKRIPVKMLPEGEYRFHVSLNTENINFLKVDTDIPFEQLSEIRNARFHCINGQAGVVL